MLKSALFPEFRPARALRPNGARGESDAGVEIRWFGTSGFAIACDGDALLIDPYFTRAGLGELCVSRLTPKEPSIRRYLPANVRGVLCGHSHFDHLLDAPLAAELAHAKLVGSGTTCAFGSAHGLSDANLVELSASGGRVILAQFDVRFVPSMHARLLLGHVPFPGEVSRPAPARARAFQYRMGGAYGIFVVGGGVRVYHNGSADLVDAELEGESADVVLVGIAGRQWAPRYLERLLSRLRPRVVIPAHHDAFFGPLEHGVRLLPGIDFDGFVREVERLLPQSQVLAPGYDEPVWIASGARNAFLMGR